MGGMGALGGIDSSTMMRNDETIPISLRRPKPTSATRTHGFGSTMSSHDHAQANSRRPTQMLSRQNDKRPDLHEVKRHELMRHDSQSLVAQGGGAAAPGARAAPVLSSHISPAINLDVSPRVRLGGVREGGGGGEGGGEKAGGQQVDTRKEIPETRSEKDETRTVTRPHRAADTPAGMTCIYICMSVRVCMCACASSPPPGLCDTSTHTHTLAPQPLAEDFFQHPPPPPPHQL